MSTVTYYIEVHTYIVITCRLCLCVCVCYTQEWNRPLSISIWFSIKMDVSIRKPWTHIVSQNNFICLSYIFFVELGSCARTCPVALRERAMRHNNRTTLKTCFLLHPLFLGVRVCVCGKGDGSGTMQYTTRHTHTYTFWPQWRSTKRTQWLVVRKTNTRKKKKQTNKKWNKRMLSDYYYYFQFHNFHSRMLKLCCLITIIYFFLLLVCIFLATYGGRGDNNVSIRMTMHRGALWREIHMHTQVSQKYWMCVDRIDSTVRWQNHPFNISFVPVLFVSVYLLANAQET